MEQHPAHKAKLLEFIKTITKKKKVYYLEGADDLATLDSTLYQTETGEPATVILFWSEKRLAQALATAEWSSYEPKETSLVEFLENYCIGLHSDGHIIGTDYNSGMAGFEILPLQLVLQSLRKLKKNKEELNFQRYENIRVFEKLVVENLPS